MFVENKDLRDAVNKLEDDSVSDSDKEKAIETIEQKADEIQDEEDLQDLTQERLKTVFEEGKKLDLPAELKSKSEQSTPEKEKPADETDEEKDSTPEDEEEKPESEDKDVEKEDKDEKEKEIPQLSEAYYRAAIHNEWTPDEIQELYNKNPELCVKTLAKIYETTNRASQDFAAIGRAKKEQAAKAEAKPELKKQEEKQKIEFKGIDIEQLRRQYPDEPLVEVVRAANEQNKLLFDKLQTIEESRPAQETDQPSEAEIRAANQQAAAIEQQIEKFFAGDDMKPYADFYGILPKDAQDWNSLTPGQKMNRWAVIQLMDEAIVGAEALGRDLKVDDAMWKAHLVVTEPLKEKIIREQIKADVKKRNKGITLEPSGSAAPESTKPSNKAELEEVTNERLRKVFG